MHKFKACPKYPRNATWQDFETFRSMTPRLMERAWNVSWTMMTGAQNKCYDITVAMVAGFWNGVTWLAECIWDKVTSSADGVWNGVTWLANRGWNGVAWLADGVWYGVTWLADGVWNGVEWLAKRTWNGVAWLADWIWNGLTWTGRLFVPGNYVTDGVVKFYYGYLDSK